MTTSDLTTDRLRQAAIDRIWETIPPFWGLVRNNLRSIASEKFDISVEQFHILRHIRRGLTSVSELADVKRISRPAISQAVDMLVDKNLITRQQDTDDRRFVKLALTASGEDLLDKIFQENRAWLVTRLAVLDPDQLQCMIEGLEALKTLLAEDAE
jgi:DNA-binding MarR family transcriptional regulator